MYHLSSVYLWKVFLPGCSDSSLLSCDTVLHSSFSEVLGIPVALFGLILGLFHFFAKGKEETYKFFLIINIIGCLILAFITFFILKTFCPYCFAYYVLSFGLLFQYRKFTIAYNEKSLLFFLLSGFGLIFAYLLIVFFTRPYKNLTKSYCTEISYNLPKGILIKKGKYDVTIIGDPNCSTCTTLLKNLQETEASIYYIPFPLEIECNPLIVKTKYKNSCKKAYYIFEHNQYPENIEEYVPSEAIKQEFSTFIKNIENKPPVLPVLIIKNNFCPGVFQKDQVEKLIYENF